MEFLLLVLVELGKSDRAYLWSDGDGVSGGHNYSRFNTIFRIA